MGILSLAGALIAGTVTLTDATGAVLPAPGVRVTLTCTAAAESRLAVSDDDGAFRFVDVDGGTCTITTDLQGFAGETTPAAVRQGETVFVALQLVTVPIRAGVTVSGPTPAWRAGARRSKGCADTCRR